MERDTALTPPLAEPHQQLGEIRVFSPCVFRAVPLESAPYCTGIRGMVSKEHGRSPKRATSQYTNPKRGRPFPPSLALRAGMRSMPSPIGWLRTGPWFAATKTGPVPEHSPAKTSTAAPPKSSGSSPGADELKDVLGELQQVGAVDPAACKELTADLKQTDPSRWPLVIQEFRAPRRTGAGPRPVRPKRSKRSRPEVGGRRSEVRSQRSEAETRPLVRKPRKRRKSSWRWRRWLKCRLSRSLRMRCAYAGAAAGQWHRGNHF